MVEVARGRRSGKVVAPPSKSHLERLMLANFLAGRPMEVPDGSCDDVIATGRCLRALAEAETEPELDCGESGATLRFLAPVAAALGKRPRWIRRGRLAERPFIGYEKLEPGLHELRGDISSQFVTGLLFALPLLNGDSEIRLVTPLESKGYVAMTLGVLRDAGIKIGTTAGGYTVPGGQVYRPQPTPAEGDWSVGAVWYVMNALGCQLEIDGLAAGSLQPDRAITRFVRPSATCRDMWETDLPAEVGVSQFPDLFPVLGVLAAGIPRRTRFTGIGRLRLKESDRVEAMREVLTKFGAGVSVEGDSFAVEGTAGDFHGGEFRTFGDHRIAMAIAAGAVRAISPVRVDDFGCIAKSWPGAEQLSESV